MGRIFTAIGLASVLFGSVSAKELDAQVECSDFESAETCVENSCKWLYRHKRCSDDCEEDKDFCCADTDCATEGTSKCKASKCEDCINDGCFWQYDKCRSSCSWGSQYPCMGETSSCPKMEEALKGKRSEMKCVNQKDCRDCTAVGCLWSASLDQCFPLCEKEKDCIGSQSQCSGSVTNEEEQSTSAADINEVETTVETEADEETSIEPELPEATGVEVTDDVSSPTESGALDFGMPVDEAQAVGGDDLALGGDSQDAFDIGGTQPDLNAGGSSLDDSFGTADSWGDATNGGEDQAQAGDNTAWGGDMGVTGDTSNSFGGLDTGINSDFGVPDTGISTDFGTADAGISTDFGTADAGISTDFGTADAGISTDFGTADAGISTDFGTADTGISTDFGMADAGINTPFGAPDTGINTPFGAPDTGINTSFSAADTGINAAFGTADTGFSTGFGTADSRSSDGLSADSGLWGGNDTSDAMAVSESPIGADSADDNAWGSFGGWGLDADTGSADCSTFTKCSECTGNQCSWDDGVQSCMKTCTSLGPKCITVSFSCPAGSDSIATPFGDTGVTAGQDVSSGTVGGGLAGDNGAADAATPGTDTKSWPWM